MRLLTALNFCLAACAGLLFIAAPAALSAGDWPQLHGPTRSGIATGEKLATTWPATGPKLLWRKEVGSGYGGPALIAGKALLFHRLEDRERIEAWDLASAKPLWHADFAASYKGGIDPDIGPRSVPTVHEGKVYLFGAASDVHCVRLADGAKLWSRALADDYSIPDSYFGAGSSPIVAGGRLWINLGAKDAGLIALDLNNGKTLYSGTTEQASYSSPALAKLSGQESVVFVTRYNCLAIDAKTGAAKFSFSFGKRGPTVNAATPLVFDNKLFVSASYGVGAKVAKLGAKQPETLWENDSSMSSQYTTCVYHNGYLYGVAGREDHADGSLRCIDVNNGDVKWKEDDYGIAHVILVNDELLIVRQNGEIVAAPASPVSFKPRLKATVTRDKIRALPALSEGKLVFRTQTGEKGGELICVEVK